MSKIITLIMAVFMVAGVSAAEPKYNLKSEVILGSYKWVKSLGGTYVPNEGNEVKVDDAHLEDHEIDLKINQAGKLIAKFYGDELEVELIDGVLTFGGSDFTDCDDPGCGDLTYINAKILPKKKGNKYIPSLTVETTMSYYHPDEEDAYYGDVNTVEEFIFDKQIIDAKPLFTNIELDRGYKNILASCVKAKQKVDALLCPEASRVRFVNPIDINNKEFKKYYSNPENLKKLSKSYLQKSVFAYQKAILKLYKIVSSDKASKKKEVTKNFKVYLDALYGYITKDKNNTVYIVSNRYGGFSKWEVQRQTLIIVNSKYNSVTKLVFDTH